MKWIPIKDQLPEFHKTLILYDGKDVFAGWLEYREEKERPSFYDVENRRFPEKVTHWMKMPNPPKKDEKCHTKRKVK